MLHVGEARRENINFVPRLLRDPVQCLAQSKSGHGTVEPLRQDGGAFAHRLDQIPTIPHRKDVRRNGDRTLQPTAAPLFFRVIRLERENVHSLERGYREDAAQCGQEVSGGVPPGNNNEHIF